MRLNYMIATIVVVLISVMALAAQISTPCAGELSGTALSMQHDAERDALSAQADAQRTEKILACKGAADCLSRTSEDFIRFEAEALRSLALSQRAAAVSHCETH